MTSTLRAAIAAVAVLALPNLAHAADYKFHLWNKTSKYKITGFQTYENEKWSTWSNVTLEPGEDKDMNWGANEGACTVPFKIDYETIQTEQYSVDWCKVKNIYVTDDNVTYD
jgi:hypothetical protein